MILEPCTKNEINEHIQDLNLMVFLIVLLQEIKPYILKNQPIWDIVYQKLLNYISKKNKLQYFKIKSRRFKIKLYVK